MYRTRPRQDHQTRVRSGEGSVDAFSWRSAQPLGVRDGQVYFRIVGIQRERLVEIPNRFFRPVRAQPRHAAAQSRIHRKLPAVQPARVGQRQLAIELGQRTFHVALGQTYERAKPVQTQGRISLAALQLAILNRGAFAKHRIRLVEVAPRDMHHRHLEVRERETGIVGERDAGGAQARAAPGRVSEPEVVTPVGRFQATARRASASASIVFQSLTSASASVACASARPSSSAIA